MNYRFQKLTTIYPQFIRQFMDNNPDYNEISYLELYDRFIRTRYGLSDFYTRHMQALGNEAQTIFASFESLQKAWARENMISYNENTWMQEIVFAQVKAFTPDVLYIPDLYLFDLPFRKQLSEVCKSHVVVIGWRFAPTDDYGQFNDLDLLLTGNAYFADKFRTNGVNTEVITQAFEHTLLNEINLPAERNLDFTFVGNVGTLNGVHSQRYDLIESLLAQTPLQIWGKVNEPPKWPFKRKVLYKSIYQTNRLLKTIGISRENREQIPLFRRGATWSSDPTLPTLGQRYPDRFYGAVFGVENYLITARSKLVFNAHIDAAAESAGNLRIFEATGMGACLVTDWKQNLPDLFQPDTEVVTYRNAEEAIEKVNYLLEHEGQRKAIAVAGQRRTLRDHTVLQQVEKIDILIREYL